MIETRRNAAAVATVERLASSGNKGSRGFSPYMELEHAPYERTFMDYKIAAPRELTRFENRFYNTKRANVAARRLKRGGKRSGGEGKKKRGGKKRETRRKKGRKKKGKRSGERIRQVARLDAYPRRVRALQESRSVMTRVIGP